MSQSAITNVNVNVNVNEREIERLIAALHHHVEEGISPETLRHLTKELERRTLAERRCAELFESEQLARAEARELEQANEAKDRFLAILSHELRTPLQPIISAASALLRDPRLPTDLLEDVRTIQRNVQLEARLIDDLLDLTRIVNGKLALERYRVNMDSVITRAVDICEPDVMGKRQTLSVKLTAKHTWVDADPGRLQQVLWNLIKNAVKFTPPGGEIVVETLDSGAIGNGSGNSGSVEDQGRLIVRVIDNGIGIAPAALPRIFDAFEQGSDDVARKHGGMGLGLAICKLLVERHEGTLSAQSEGEGRGATFTLALPTIEPTPAAVAGPRGAYTDVPKRRLRILLVEDDQDSNLVMSKLLKTVGHDVTGATDCASARARLAEGSFDLLVCDLGLPDGSGLDVMSKLRGSGVRGIALTGYGSENDIRASLDAGFDVHLTKPITLGPLVSAIDKLTLA
jgi:signal transduction histidine kinase